jgi:DNA-binding CsgD family transcriptional regulator
LLRAWAIAELIEAAARSGKHDEGAAALARLSGSTRAAATDWALGIEARSRALLSQDKDAERLYRESLDRLARTRIRAELARAHLLFGEWLRRERRPLNAREQLRMAYEMFTAMGAQEFAERARAELAATGTRLRKHKLADPSELSPQEARIARLASTGLSNVEIAAQLFISANTVDFHLRKVFQKLGIRSRAQLHQALSATADDMEADHGPLPPVRQPSPGPPGSDVWLRQPPQSVRTISQSFFRTESWRLPDGARYLRMARQRGAGLNPQATAPWRFMIRLLACRPP